MPLTKVNLKWVQFSSVTQSCPPLCDPMDYSTPGLPVHHQLPEFTQTHVPLSWWCHPTISSSVVCFFSCLQSFPELGSFPVSQFLIGWPNDWSFSFSISPSDEHSGLISFRMDWLDLLVVHGTLKSLLQHHSSKASNLLCSAFFLVQLSHPYMTIGKTIALTIRTFVGKVMSLLFNILSRLVIALFPKEQASFSFMAAVTICSDFGAPQNKVPQCFPIYLPWSHGTGWIDWMGIRLKYMTWNDKTVRRKC